MKKILISSILAMCFLLNGCFNYKDINRVLFATSILIDIDEDNNPIVYVETFKPYRSAISGSEKGQRIIYKGKGKTIFEALRTIGLSTSYKINATQNKALIFTEKAARYGMHDFIDLMGRDQEFIIRQYIVIYQGDVDRLLKANIKSEEYIGLFITDLIENIGTSSRSIKLSTNDYLNKRLSPGGTVVATLLKMSDDQLEELLIIDGGSIIKNDKLIVNIPIQDSQGYNFLVDQVKTGTLEIPYLSEENKYATLEIRNSRTKTNMEYDGKNLKLIKTINVRTTLAETQAALDFTPENLEKIAKGAEDNIIRATRDVFEKYKNNNLDIFNVERDFQIRYPHADWKDILQDTTLEVKAKVVIEGSSNRKGFH
ncbi:Ger(x)C family spore germination protein [uncultured Clostridium sp.]|uniref:Ger(x)C family spore germination protein n=1 Tax=uncultured Clostridium sp. TaxID=59620 RepID=UPI0028F10DB2|nr:Ger(x)C family spore germination protein [uncultured Clostridium sp.]